MTGYLRSRLGLVRRFLVDESAEGTSSGALRIALWVVVALGVLAFVGPKLYASLTTGGNCMTSVSSFGTASFAAGTMPTC